MTKRVVLSLAAVLAVLLLVIAVNTLRHGSRQIEVAPVEPLKLDENAAAQRLAAAVRLRTISFDGQSAASAAEFRKLHVLLRNPFRARMPCSSASS
jgi:carboxypeptidase PM20D1